MHIMVTKKIFFGTKKNLPIYVTQLKKKTLCEKFFRIKNFMSKSCRYFIMNIKVTKNFFI